ncbi:MAG: RNA polymerase sigma factor, partial [bacterium]
MDRVRAGDAEVFEAVFRLHGPKVRGRILAVGRDGDTADDLVQEVFLRLWTRAEQWEERGTLAGWLMLIGFNLALNHLRGVRRRHEQPLEPPGDAVPDWMIDTGSLGPEALAETSEERALLRSLLGRLPDEQQEVVRMVHEAGMEI